MRVRGVVYSGFCASIFMNIMNTQLVKMDEHASVCVCVYMCK